LIMQRIVLCTYLNVNYAYFPTLSLLFFFFFLLIRRPPISPLFPYTTLFRSGRQGPDGGQGRPPDRKPVTPRALPGPRARFGHQRHQPPPPRGGADPAAGDNREGEAGGLRRDRAHRRPPRLRRGHRRRHLPTRPDLGRDQREGRPRWRSAGHLRGA